MALGSLAPLQRYVVMKDGAVAPGARAFFCLSGTNTPQPVYTNSALTVPHTNPVVADMNGVLPVIYFSAVAYRVWMTDANGVTIFTPQDNIYDWAQYGGSDLAYQNQSNYFNNASGQRFSAGLAIDNGTPSTHGIVMPSAVPAVTTTNLHNNAGTLKWSGNISDSVGTMATIRAGGIGIASQGAGDVPYATSATQLGRVNGSGILQLNGSSAPTVIATSAVGAYKFLGEAHGTVLGGAGSTNVGNFAISGLTIYDSLYVQLMSETPGPAGSITLVNTTDGVTVFTVGVQNGNFYQTYATLACSPIANTNVTALGINSTPALSLARSTFVTPFTSPFTLAVNVAPTNDWSYSVRVYKIVGQ